MRVIFAVLITILALGAQASIPDGGPRHASLTSREGVAINVDFQRTVVANGGSSAANYFAEGVKVTVTLPTRSCRIDPVEIQINNWKIGSSESATQYKATARLQIAEYCTYQLQVPGSLPIRSVSQGHVNNYRQYIAVKVGGKYLTNPYRNNGEDKAYFEVQLEEVPGNGPSKK